MSRLQRLWNVFRRSQLDDDLREDIDAHLALVEREEQAHGFSVQEARARARTRFGNVRAHRERAIDAVLATWLDTWVLDVRVAVRQVVRRPGFAASVIVLLALGIGLNAGIFTVIKSVVLRPLPLADPDRLVIVTERTGRFETPTSWPDFLDLREGARVLKSAAAFTRSVEVVFGAAGEARNIRGSSVTLDYFETLGVLPIAGRLFNAAEADRADGAALLREDFWTNAMNADPSVIGHAVPINGRPVTIVGILPRGFRFPSDDVVIWLPLQPRGQERDRGWHAFSMVGRLERGVTLARAQSDLDTVMERLRHEYPEKVAGRHAAVRTLQASSLDATFRDRLVVLQIAALVLCLIACANISGLLLARYSSRRGEFSIRTALGATRMRLLRQHLTESLLLTLMGLVGAAAFAWASVRFLVWLYGGALPRAGEIAPDWPLIGLVMMGATLLALCLGAITALHQAAEMPRGAIRSASRITGLGRTVRTRRVLVVSQVVSAVVLLSVTGAMVQRVWSLVHVDIGIDRAHLTTMEINLPSGQYPGGPSIGAFFERAVDRVRQVPGVTSTAAINMLPIADWGFNGGVNVEGGLPSPPGFFAEYRWVTSDYFRTMVIPVTRGRPFLPEEMAGTRRAAIINETMAQRLWGEADPLGARIRFLSPEWSTVVGVVRDVRQTGLAVPPSAELFVPAASYTAPFSKWSLILRSTVPLESMMPAVRRAIQDVDRGAAIDRVRTMDDVVVDSLSNQRIVMTLLVAFGILALVLAIVGTYSLIAYAVVVRAPEIALRAALGSTPGALVSLIGRQGIVLVGIGVGLGLPASLAASTVLGKSLFGVARVGWPVLIGVAAILLVTGGLAALIPAARATRIDPLRALREE